jgi:hypothetical protein
MPFGFSFSLLPGVCEAARGLVNGRGLPQPAAIFGIPFDTLRGTS